MVFHEVLPTANFVSMFDLTHVRGCVGDRCNRFLEEEVFIRTEIFDDSIRSAETRVGNVDAPSTGSSQEQELINGKIPENTLSPRDISMSKSQEYDVGKDDYRNISYIYLFSLCWSPILLLLDVGTDTYLAYQYYVHEERTYFFLTVAFVVLPALISTTFSIRMYVLEDERVPSWKWALRCVLLVLQISPVVRYFEAFQHALAAKRNRKTVAECRHHSALLMKEDSNLALLRILECFLESAPQQVVQITILLTPGRPTISPTLQIYLYVSLLFSFVSTSWTLATYHRSIRFAQADKANMKWIATFVQFLWIFFIMISRILAISEAAALYPLGTLFVCFVHWCVMTAWLIAYEETWFCYSPSNGNNTVKKFNESLFCAVIGLIYIFSFVAVNDKPTRYRYTFYYSVCFVEILTLIIVWFVYGNSVPVKVGFAFSFVLPVTILGVFVLGIAMMVVYYKYFHPSMHCKADVLSWHNIAMSPSVEERKVSCSTQT